jgi:hypothetical protein
VVGYFRAFTHNNEGHADESEKLNLADPSMELVAAGYLNPYARADIVVGWHGEHNAEIEEVYGTVLRGLPLGMNLRVGKYLLEYGRLNPVHEHAWSFVKRPLPHEAFFGEEGLSDMAIRPAFLLPTGETYTELMFSLIKGDALAGHHHHEEEGEHAEEEHGHSEEEGRRDLGFFGRLTSSFATAENAELAFGASVLNAVHGFTAHEETDSVAHEHEHEEEPEQLRSWIFGGDLKYKYKPSRYTSLQIEAEGIVRTDEQHESDDLTSYGGYGYLDYRFRQKYNVGGIFEYLRQKSAEHHHEEGEEEEIHIHQHDTWRAGCFVGFAPIEETSLVRLAGHYTDPDEGDSFWEVTLQFVFSLGPHQPHNF